MTPLHFACYNGCVANVKQILKLAQDKEQVNLRNAEG